MPVTKVEDISSFEEVTSKEERVLVKFKADWCMPCKAMEPIVEDVSNQFPSVKVISVDIDGDGVEKLIEQYQVKTVPTFVHLVKGDKKDSLSGTISKKELSSLIQG